MHRPLLAPLRCTAAVFDAHICRRHAYSLATLVYGAREGICASEAVLRVDNGRARPTAAHTCRRQLPFQRPGHLEVGPVPAHHVAAQGADPVFALLFSYNSLGCGQALEELGLEVLFLAVEFANNPGLLPWKSE